MYALSVDSRMRGDTSRKLKRIPSQPNPMADHVYHLPSLAKRLRGLEPGTVVTHKYLPGVPLEVVSGPTPGILGPKYLVKMSEGKPESAYAHNLIQEG